MHKQENPGVAMETTLAQAAGWRNGCQLSASCIPGPHQPQAKTLASLEAPMKDSKGIRGNYWNHKTSFHQHTWWEDGKLIPEGMMALINIFWPLP